LIDALRELEGVVGKKDSKKCFKVEIHRNATRKDFTAGIIGSCDIAYTITHGAVSTNDPDDRWMIFGPRQENNLSLEGYARLAEKHQCELKPFGCYIAPRRDNTTCGNAMIQAITSSIKSLRPDCCPSVKKVCLFFGPDGGAQPNPPYPPAWNP
jgi:hypothetical protein